MKKYEMTNESIEFIGVKLFRIRALQDFRDVKAGDLGGYIEKEDNLSQYDYCWVYDNAKVFGNAKVRENARIYDYAKVHENAWVDGNSEIYGNAEVYGNAEIRDMCQIYDNAKVRENTIISGRAKVYECARVSYSCISGSACVHGDIDLYNSAEIRGNADVYKDTHVLQIGAIGSRDDTTTFFRTKCKEIYVVCGCFGGDIEKFEKAVEEEHKGTKYEKTYKLAAELAKLQIELED
ncbi:hypothetical protein [uncultured Clostridium sp.]|jgi:carbonic anhydrase/acetyltransferase-like protein (isoleucine patch superfamily)|uniref:hypothetical protein n=1 Tax=uncultured Clostridium sp. TaxID=59620 RepID=UPI0025D20838|nr:hypothetical protein [uncultured Clostridium sp.]